MISMNRLILLTAAKSPSTLRPHRIGSDCVKVDPAKIVGVVKTDEPNEGGKFSPLDDVTMAIGQNVATS